MKSVKIETASIFSKIAIEENVQFYFRQAWDPIKSKLEELYSPYTIKEQTFTEINNLK